MRVKVQLISILITLVCPFLSGYGQDNINPLIGDWRAEDGKYFAQIYKDGDGLYKTNIVLDLSSREKPLDVLESQDLKEGSVFEGENWEASIKSNKLVLRNKNEEIKMDYFVRTSPTLKSQPPANGIVLFDGSNLNAWKKVTDKDWLEGSIPADNWKILPSGALQVVPKESGNSESIISKEKFGDLKLHLEFRLLGDKTNGGVYLMSRYEINIKDAYGKYNESPIGFGNIEDPKDFYPDFNVAFPPGQWQTFDIDFKAPRFDKNEKKTEHAKITVYHNGVKIYDNVELKELKGSTKRLGETTTGPLYLQEHGTAYEFRNIWIVDQTLSEDSENVSEEKNKGGRKNIDDRKTNDKKSTKGGNKKSGKQGEKGQKGKDTKAGYEEELNPLYANVEIDISEKDLNKPAGPAGFIHPGVLLNMDQLKEMKRRVQKGIEPQASAFKDLVNSSLGNLNYKPTPWETVSCGPRSTPNLGCKDEQRDGAAAYSQALLWFITENEKYAINAMNIMNSWAEKLKGGHDYANAPVQAAWVGSLWPRTAEIIRYTYTGWSDPEIAKFQNMLRTQYLPVIIHGDCENGNKELAMSEALINIGVFLDDRTVFNLGLEIWRGRTPAYIYLKEDGEEPIQPPGCPPAYWSNKGLMPDLVDGILQETARDSHHHGMAFASLANAAETARQQGINLYGEEAKRIMASLEYVAQYLPPNNVHIPENLSFELLHTWEIAFNHYHNRLGFEMPYTTKIIPTNRPTGVDHHMAWETLTHGDMGKIGLPELSGEKNY